MRLAGQDFNHTGSTQGKRKSPNLGVVAHWPTPTGVGLLADGLSARLDRYWERESEGVPRVATGVPERGNQLRALGNALVPQIAQWIGERIVS